MAMATESTCVTQIGETAGRVWSYLAAKGPMAITKLVKEVDAPRDVFMQAIGWLAREDKIVIEEESRKKIVSLRETGA